MPTPRRAADPPPDLYDYADYRLFLKDWYAHRKRRDPRYSYGVFARKAGVSRALLGLTMTHRWDLRPASVEKFASAMGLPQDRRELFSLLVEASRARGKAREALSQEIAARRLARLTKELSVAEVRDYYGAWHHTVVHALAFMRGFRAEPRWISRRLGGCLTSAQAGASIALLKRMGILRLRPGKRAEASRIRASVPPGTALRASFPEWVRLKGLDLLRREASGCDFSTSQAVMSPAEAEALADKLKQAARTHVPPGSGPRSGELYAVIADVVPLSRPSAVPGPVLSEVRARRGRAEGSGPARRSR